MMHYQTPKLLTVVVATCMAVSSNLAAENWPRFRGPNGGAVADKVALPLHWDANQNIRWKAAIPGEGFSSPIVWQDKVFLTAASPSGQERMVHCIDRETGKLLWSQSIHHGNPERTSAMTGHAAATPTTDGEHVVAAFGNAGIVCYDLAGKLLWRQSLGEFDTELGLASSPIIVGHRVILVCDHDGDRFTSFDSFLVALDVTSGKPLWKSERRGLTRSWSTPIVVPGNDGKKELIVSAQDHVRAYDPDTGLQLWHVAGTTGWVAPSPVFGNGAVYVVSGKNGPVAAIRPGGAGDVTATHVAWRHETGGAYVCSPILYGDLLYAHTEQGVLTCYDARTGAIRYQQRLDGKFTASPVAGDGRIYCTNEDGNTYTIKAGPRYELLARNALEEYCLASPALVDGQLLMRTEKHLYCIEERAGK
jgi:outer membrane protein assembly factor BamB